MEEILASLLTSPQATAGRIRQLLVSDCRLVGEKVKLNLGKPLDLVAEGLTSGTWYPVVDKLRTSTELDPETSEVLCLSAGSEGFGLTAYGFHPTMLETDKGRAKLEC